MNRFKNLLYIGMGYYSYESLIKKAIENKGYNTCYCVDNTIRYKKYIGQKAYTALTKIYHDRLLHSLQNVDLDIILVIVGRQLTPYFLTKLHEMHKNAKFILYFWDDVARVENFSQVSSFYDEIYSFDYPDCVKYNFKFLPLFYVPNYYCDNHNVQASLDVFSAMSWHSDRFELCEKFTNINKVKNEIYILSGRKKFIIWNMNLRNLKKKIEAEKNGIYISYKKLSMEYVAQKVKTARAILDIPFQSQRGLSIRTIESLAAQRKLITTNPEVKNYDFYNENNVFILDRDKPYVPIEFIKSPYNPVDSRIIKKYSLNTWVDAILENKQENYRN